MYHTCLHCTRGLGRNEVLEMLPIGRRVAFDAAQGRLWVVCSACGRWNLVPFDTRLETIDACERLFRDTRLRYSTDNIGLARVREGLDLVRIGAPQRPEFASWRYGEQYRRRRRQNLLISGAGVVGTMLLGMQLELAAASTGFAAMMAGLYGPQVAWGYWRKRQDRFCARIHSNGTLVKFDRDTANLVHVGFQGGELSVWWSKGTFAALHGRILVMQGGSDVRILLRRILGITNRMVGSAGALHHAVALVEQGPFDSWLIGLTNRSRAPGPRSGRETIDRLGQILLPFIHTTTSPEYMRGFEPNTVALASINGPDRLAIEMWLSEEDEAKALAGELALLERQWREAEELAAIADKLLTDAALPA